MTPILNACAWLMIFIAPFANITSSIAQTYPAGACSLVPSSKTCIDATPCKTDVNGYQVCLAGISPAAGGGNTTASCWQYSYQYSCSGSAVSIDTCTTYANNSACSMTASKCINTSTLTKQCDQWEYTYQCQTQAATTQQQMVCTSSLVDDLSTSHPSNSNNSFIQAALAQEIMNQGGTYTKGGLFFSGVRETCTKGWYGIKDCCKPAPGAQSNSMFAATIYGNAASTVKYLGSAAIDWASPYVFDMMYSNGWSNSFTNCTNGTNLAASGFSLSAYGFTYSTVAPAAGSGLFGANTTWAMGNNGYVTFNPYVFTALVAIAVYQNLSSCTQDEQMLALHKGAGLSAFINEYCSNNNALLGCVVYTSNYCSFNSVLAKIINIQGKTQLGLDVSNCNGVTATQLGQIDFSKIDFSEFSKALTERAKNNSPSSASLKNGYASMVTTKAASQSIPAAAAQVTSPPVVTKKPTPSVEYLVVGGGAGGTGGQSPYLGFIGGGGGGGGFQTGTALAVTAGANYPVTVGLGGVAGGNVTRGGHGGFSQFSSVIAYGGSGDPADASATTASASGGDSWGGVANAGYTNNGGQGAPGGSGSPNGTNNGASGGGGGCGGSGGAGQSTYAVGGLTGLGGTGGAGLSSNITGVAVVYCGGGSGIGQAKQPPATGNGGGGWQLDGTFALDAPANRGGGGAGYDYQQAAGKGGSGIVVIRYPDTFDQATSVTSGAYTHITGFHVYTFTSSGAITF